MLNDLLIAFGVNFKVIPKLWERSRGTSINGMRIESSLKDMAPIHATLDHYKKQLLPGDKLDKFNSVLFSHLSNSLSCEGLYHRYGSATIRVSLKDFCAEVLIDALSRTMFGDRIYEIEPDLVQNMVDFNEDAWMLMFHYPQSPDSKLHKARRKLLDFFLNYMHSPKEVRSGQTWLIDRVLDDLNAIDISDEDKAPLLLLIYWG